MQGLNQLLLHCRRFLYRLSHQEVLLLMMLPLSHFSHVLLCATPRWQPTRLLCPRGSPGENSGASCHFLLQGIFPTQGSNPQLLPLSCFAGRFFITESQGKRNLNYIFKFCRFLTVIKNIFSYFNFCWEI